MQAFREVGIRAQRRRREYLRILKPVEVREHDKFIAVYPGSGYSIAYDIDFPKPIGKSGFELDLSQGAYGSQIAPARTFGFREDEQKLRDMGLAAAAARWCYFLLALAGHHILGRVVAERAGHAMHTTLVSRLLRDRSAWELVTVGSPKRAVYAAASLATA